MIKHTNTKNEYQSNTNTTIKPSTQNYLSKPLQGNQNNHQSFNDSEINQISYKLNNHQHLDYLKSSDLWLISQRLVTLDDQLITNMKSRDLTLLYLQTSYHNFNVLIKKQLVNDLEFTLKSFTKAVYINDCSGIIDCLNPSEVWILLKMDLNNLKKLTDEFPSTFISTWVNELLFSQNINDLIYCPYLTEPIETKLPKILILNIKMSLDHLEKKINALAHVYLVISQNLFNIQNNVTKKELKKAQIQLESFCLFNGLQKFIEKDNYTNKNWMLFYNILQQEFMSFKFTYNKELEKTNEIKNLLEIKNELRELYEINNTTLLVEFENQLTEYINISVLYYQELDFKLVFRSLWFTIFSLNPRKTKNTAYLHSRNFLINLRDADPKLWNYYTKDLDSTIISFSSPLHTNKFSMYIIIAIYKKLMALLIAKKVIIAINNPIIYNEELGIMNEDSGEEIQYYFNNDWLTSFQKEGDVFDYSTVLSLISTYSSQTSRLIPMIFKPNDWILTKNKLKNNYTGGYLLNESREIRPLLINQIEQVHTLKIEQSTFDSINWLQKRPFLIEYSFIKNYWINFTVKRTNSFLFQVNTRQFLETKKNIKNFKIKQESDFKRTIYILFIIFILTIKSSKNEFFISIKKILHDLRINDTELFKKNLLKCNTYEEIQCLLPNIELLSSNIISKSIKLYSLTKINYTIKFNRIWEQFINKKEYFSYLNNNFMENTFLSYEKKIDTCNSLINKLNTWFSYYYTQVLLHNTYNLFNFLMKENNLPIYFTGTLDWRCRFYYLSNLSPTASHENRANLSLLDFYEIMYLDFIFQLMKVWYGGKFNKEKAKEMYQNNNCLQTMINWYNNPNQFNIDNVEDSFMLWRMVITVNQNYAVINRYQDSFDFKIKINYFFHADATSSGAQILALVAGDFDMFPYLNLALQEKTENFEPQNFYLFLARNIFKKLKRPAIIKKKKKSLTSWEFVLKNNKQFIGKNENQVFDEWYRFFKGIIKKAGMVTLYGRGEVAFVKHVWSELLLNNFDIIIVNKKELSCLISEFVNVTLEYLESLSLYKILNIYKQFAAIFSLLGIPISWKTSNTEIIKQQYVVTYKNKISLYFNKLDKLDIPNSKIKPLRTSFVRTENLLFNNSTVFMDKNKNTIAITANFIHSFDSALLFCVVNLIREDYPNISIFVIHDCIYFPGNLRDEILIKIRYSIFRVFLQQNTLKKQTNLWLSEINWRLKNKRHLDLVFQFEKQIEFLQNKQKLNQQQVTELSLCKNLLNDLKNIDKLVIKLQGSVDELLKMQDIRLYDQYYKDICILLQLDKVFPFI